MSSPPRRRLSQTWVKQPVYCRTAEDAEDSFLDSANSHYQQPIEQVDLTQDDDWLSPPVVEGMPSPVPSSQDKWSQPTWPDSEPIAPTSPPPQKRKADDDIQKPPRKKRVQQSLDTFVDNPYASSTLLNIPYQLEHLRQAVFSLAEKIVWTPQQFEEYWPFMSNFWTRMMRRPVTKKGTQVEHYNCRLYRGDTISETHGKRQKTLRKHPPCAMKIKINNEYSPSNHNVLLSVTFSLHTDPKTICLEHNHSLAYIDQIKRTMASRLSPGLRCPRDMLKRTSTVTSMALAIRQTGGLSMLLAVVIGRSKIRTMPVLNT